MVHAHTFSGNGVSVSTTVSVLRFPPYALAESADGSADSRGGDTGTQSSTGAGLARNLELHQSVHAVSGGTWDFAAIL